MTRRHLAVQEDPDSSAGVEHTGEVVAPDTEERPRFYSGKILRRSQMTPRPRPRQRTSVRFSRDIGHLGYLPLPLHLLADPAREDKYVIRSVPRALSTTDNVSLTKRSSFAVLFSHASLTFFHYFRVKSKRFDLRGRSAANRRFSKTQAFAAEMRQGILKNDEIRTVNLSAVSG